MRKILSISLGSVYALLSLGLHIHMHLCQDRVADVSLFGDVDNCHEEEKDLVCEKGHDCCDFQHVDLTIEEAHQPVKKVDFSTVSIVDNTPLVFAPDVDEELKQPVNSEPFRGPPESIFLMNCSLTFYG